MRAATRVACGDKKATTHMMSGFMSCAELMLAAAAAAAVGSALVVVVVVAPPRLLFSSNMAAAAGWRRRVQSRRARGVRKVWGDGARAVATMRRREARSGEGGGGDGKQAALVDRSGDERL